MLSDTSHSSGPGTYTTCTGGGCGRDDDADVSAPVVLSSLLASVPMSPSGVAAPSATSAAAAALLPRRLVFAVLALALALPAAAAEPFLCRSLAFAFAFPFAFAPWAVPS